LRSVRQAAGEGGEHCPAGGERQQNDAGGDVLDGAGERADDQSRRRHGAEGQRA
jgi:hypothetical protein